MIDDLTTDLLNCQVRALFRLHVRFSFGLLLPLVIYNNCLSEIFGHSEILFGSYHWLMLIFGKPTGLTIYSLNIFIHNGP